MEKTESKVGWIRIIFFIIVIIIISFLFVLISEGEAILSITATSIILLPVLGGMISIILTFINTILWWFTCWGIGVLFSIGVYDSFWHNLGYNSMWPMIWLYRMFFGHMMGEPGFALEDEPNEK